MGASPAVARFASAVAVALALGACSGLPSTSGVLEGRRVDERVAAEARVIVPPPAEGASREAVALGFIRAGAAFQEADDNQSSVGKSYLAPEAVDVWRPTSSVTVFDRNASLVVTAVSEHQVRVRTEAVAVVDSSGRYRELAPQTPVEALLDLVRIDGEWRVLLPADGFGIWLDTDDFGLLFDAYAVTFTAAGGRRLVPDVRWFATGPRLVTALARAQLGAVPAYLAGAVQTGIPEATKLAVDAVAVQDQIAHVVLSSSANTADVERRRAMWAQFAATLTQVPGVSGVSVEVVGVGPMLVPEVTGSVSSPAEVGYNTVAPAALRTGLLRVADRLARVDLTQLDDIDAEPTMRSIGPGTPELPAVPAGQVGLAMSADGADLAAVSADGSEITRWRGAAQGRVPGLGARLTRPAYDGTGRLWVGGQAPSGAAGIWSVDASSTVGVPAQPVDAQWLAGRVPLAVAVSREGTRLAVLTRAAAGGDTRLDVAGILRDASGRPTALATGYRQGEPLIRLVDVTWIDDRTLAVLGGLGQQDGIRVFSVDLGQGVGLRRVGLNGPALGLGTPVAGALAVVTAGSSRGFAVMTDAPSVVVRAGSTWRRLGAATELVVPPAR